MAATDSTIEAETLRLHDAMAGFGTNEDALIEIIGGTPRPRLMKIGVEYINRYHKSMWEDIKGDTSGNFGKLLQGLVTPRGIYLAELIHLATHGLGTNDRLLIDVVCQICPQEVKLLNNEYEPIYKKTAEHVVHSDTSGNYRKILISVLQGSRPEPGTVDESTVASDSDRMFASGEASRDDAFVEIIPHRSAEHLQRVSHHMKTAHGHTLEAEIIKRTCGDFQDALLALCTPRANYIAKSIFDATHISGTNNSLLIRIFCMNDRETLQAGIAAYHQRTNRNMVDDIVADVSGPLEKKFRQLLVRLLQ
ncbi:annexin VII [Pelomyxa schiedti]|nr:annexin VII [Pelomyxa schiedti]